MKITPIDIAHKVFAKKFMGLDTDEVTDFLQQVAAEMENLIHEKNNLKESLREKDLRLMEYKERDQVLQSTIATASQMSDRLRKDAEKEAHLIIVDAQQKAEMLIMDTRESLKHMYQEVSELKRMRMQFQANLKALAQAHLALIDQGEVTMPQMHLPNHHIQSNSKTSVSPLSAE